VLSGGQPSPYELAFGVELDPNLHAKMVPETSVIPYPIEICARF